MLFRSPLRAEGIEPAIGHDARNVPVGAEVVVSTAIAPDNPELARAERALHRGDLLAEVSRLRRCIAVAGAHGKTTTACMCAHVLIEAGAAPSFYGMSVVDGDQVAKIMGAKLRGLATSQVMPYPWSESDPTARAFHKECESAKLPVAYHVYEGYLNGLVVTEGLRRAGRNLTRASLHTAMRGMKARIAGVDIDYTGGNATGSHFVELVYVGPDGHYRR